ncbi:MAG: hypothetical protein AAGA76_15210 [Pseudomonadota bacterium]
MPEIIVADHHDQVYSVWKDRDMKNLSVAHVDFHCDMRGILIDRPKGHAFYTSHRESTFVDRGNFLAHAIMEGIVSRLRWIHCDQSGRGFDFGPVVNYETDLLADWYRLKHRLSKQPEVEFDYTEQRLEQWSGPLPGDQLDLDWDALASVEHPKEKREKLVSDFLSRDFQTIPELTFLIYSPGYSDPDRTLYNDFAKELASKFKAEINELPKTKLVTDGERFSAVRGVVRSFVPQSVLDAKRNVSRWKNRMQAANDLKFYAEEA